MWQIMRQQCHGDRRSDEFDHDRERWNISSGRSGESRDQQNLCGKLQC